MKMNIFIHRLVLDGLPIPYHCQQELKTAVETELALLFADNHHTDGLLTGGSVSNVYAGNIPSADESDSGHLGQQIARAVYEGVNR
jgi:hypothetical protein